MTERTFSIIKPNAVAAGAVGQILDAMLADGFRIIGLKLVCMSRNEAEKFYAVHRGKPFYGRLVTFMTSGPSVVLVLEREDAVAGLRRLAGATDPAKAAEGTLRRRFGENVTRGGGAFFRRTRNRRGPLCASGRRGGGRSVLRSGAEVRVAGNKTARRTYLSQKALSLRRPERCSGPEQTKNG